jgi:SAM-dependent methyltransferase
VASNIEARLSDSVARFSGRAEVYARSRPGYPLAVIVLLRDEIGLEPAHVVADVGSGTGLSTEPFLENGNVVYAVEPNSEMRAVAEARLSGRPGFRSIAGRAEATLLRAASVDVVVAGQAFHWFDPTPTRNEFRRILRNNGWVVLLWNRRRTDTPFLREFEETLDRFGTDYARVRRRAVGPELLAQFFGGPYQQRLLSNEQIFDLNGLIERVSSTSYAPRPGQPAYEPMLQALTLLYERHAAASGVRMTYDLELYFGRLA